MKKLDKSIVLVPTILVIVIGLLITIFPVASTTVIETLRNILGNKFGWYYLVFGLAILGVMIYMAFSKIGKIKLGKDNDKPLNLFAWSAMIFTATMAADILFYAFPMTIIIILAIISFFKELKQKKVPKDEKK